MAGKVKYKNGLKAMGEDPSMKSMVQKFENSGTGLGKAEIERRFRR